MEITGSFVLPGLRNRDKGTSQAYALGVREMLLQWSNESVS